MYHNLSIHPRDPQDSQKVKSRALRLLRLLGHQTGSPEENFTETCNTPTSWKGWVPPGTSHALLLSGPWGLNIPGQKHQSVSLRELTESFFFTFTLRYNVNIKKSSELKIL